MKKVIAVVLAAIVALSLCVTSSMAADPKVTIESKTIKTSDKTFTVKGVLSEEIEIKGLSISTVVYDTNNFKLVEQSWNVPSNASINEVMNMDDDIPAGVVAYSKNTKISGTVFELKFEVLSTAKANTTDISCRFDAKLGKTLVCNTVVAGKVTIECASHKYADNWTQKSAATCTAAEKLHRFCTVCGSGEQIKDGKDALGHDFKVNTTPATCEADGKEVTTCSRCDYTSTKTLPKLGHKFTKYTQVKAPTCTEVGKEEATCDHEGCTKTDTRDIKALGHKFGEFKETKAPTCTEKGTKTASCENAGCTETIEEPIPKLTKEVKTGDDAKVEVVIDSDEPFTGYTEVKVGEVATSEADKVDGKDVVGGYKIDIIDADTNEPVAADKKVNAKIKLTDAMKAAYKDFDVAIDGTALGATVTEDGYLTFTAEAGKLAKVVVIGTKIETNGGNNGSNSGENDGNSGSSTSPKTGEATGAALAVTLFAAAAAGVVLSKKKRG